MASFVAPQAVVAVLMTKHHGKLAVAKEVGLVLTCLRPAVEVVRLWRGAAQHNRKTYRKSCRYADNCPETCVNR